MTKAEELKLLERIEALIAEAGADSYIALTFADMGKVCRNNIENDWGDSPVADLADLRDSIAKKDTEIGAQIVRLEHERDTLRSNLEAKDAEIEKLGHLLDSKTAECERIKDERDAMSDCLEGSNMMLDQAEAEIRKLKAEIVRMRLSMMTDKGYAELYDAVKGVD